MKNTMKAIASFILVIGTLLFSNQAQAQFQANLNGNFLAPTESGTSFSDGLWGGGATLRYFVRPDLAVGINGRYFATSNSANFTVDPGAGIGGRSKPAEIF
jgi:hypothetical protein